MASTPSPRSTPAPQEESSPRSSARNILPDRSVPNQPLENKAPSSGGSFVPAWRRPTIQVEGEDSCRPSVQFVPQVKTSSGLTSRSSSAKPPPTRKISNPTESARGRRLSSPPPPAKFRPSVGFDTFSNPSASDFSLTLNRKHRDYEYTKRSRTFLCGTDTNEYSDTALEWLIDELVDDGDEVVCLRVVEKDSREAIKWAGGQGEKGYRREAERFIEAIERKNTDDRAISLVLEFSIGKVHDTIQQMIRIYEPAILVVGTRGRSLTGYQGLLSSGSVSKYCLQYSPVPVIVVRPSSKREAKKRKRLQDPDRQGYRDILDKSEDAPRGRGGHLLDQKNRQSVMGSDLGLLGELGKGDPDEEARKVAEAIGYRPENRGRSMNREAGSRGSSRNRAVSNASARSQEDVTSPRGDERLLKSPTLGTLDSPMGSDDEDEGDGDEDANRLQESVRPEDEAAMLAYQRAQDLMQDEQEEAEKRAQREKERSASRGAGSRRGRRRGNTNDDDDEGGGAAVLGLLAQLDRGIK
ncbi:adenine nucleotide alpha hydrolases-like protein [Hortaea werneckii]|nr:adenine nucleotide alpha hydrolases-like protein [Hortaea werneckii]